MTRAERQALERSQRRRSRIKVAGKMTGAIGNLISAGLMVLLCSLVLCLVQSRLSGEAPTVAGHRMYVVVSGSMKPAFDAGSLVAVKPVKSAELAPGDIISFDCADGTVVTHRIVRVSSDGLGFITKGDANAVEDSGAVTANRILGRVSLAIPCLGRMLVFSQSKPGLLVLIILPALTILIFEARALWLYACQLDRKKAEKAELIELQSQLL